ncbi:MAG: hypothetical protein ACREMH_03975 [Gemmatimonadales bacterium]
MRKTADESVTDSTTLQNDNHLSFSIAASEAWSFQVFLAVNASTDGRDIKIGFTVPSGATVRWGAIGPTTGVSIMTDVRGNFASQSGSATGSCCTANFGVPLDDSGALETVIMIKGTVVNGSTAGTLQLQWAQATAGAGTSTTVLADSWLIGLRF